MSMLKLFFYIINLIFVAFYLYPGSILGRIIYGDFKKQPQLTNDFNFSFLDFSDNDKKKLGNWLELPKLCRKYKIKKNLINPIY